MIFNKDIFKKAKKKYRFSFHNENTLSQIWSFTVTKTGAIIGSVVLFFILIFLISYLVVATPLRTLLPGYLKNELRNEYIYNNIKLDSIEQNIENQSQFFVNLNRILKDSINANSANLRRDTLITMNTDSLIKPSQREIDFVKQYNENEKFNLTVLAPLAAEGLVFAKPVSGNIISDSKDEKQQSFINGISISVSLKSPVSAIFEGSVISFSQSIENDIEIIIQHANGFISKYKGLSTVYISQGDKVTAAQRIGTTNGKIFGFEIWHNGTAVNPEDFISF